MLTDPGLAVARQDERLVLPPDPASFSTEAAQPSGSGFIGLPAGGGP